MPVSVTIRFYEELNDFLPTQLRKKAFRHTCFGSPSVKDIIESLGIPHTEVDLILVNSQPVDFHYRPVGEDQISVYPVFESLDIGSINLLRDKPLREPRFVADVHLGRLARYLRLLGFDTLYRNDLEDQEIAEISAHKKRIVLTRDMQLLKNNLITHGYYVRSRKPEPQVREVLQRFDLGSKINPFHRCTECNGIIESVNKEDIIHLIPPKTRDYFHDFFQCSQCSRVYWKGSHYQEMTEWIRKITKELKI